MMKRLAITTLKGLGWLLLALALVWAAWFASNNRWVDSPAQPAPPSLQLSAPSLSREMNGFYALAALDRPADGRPAPWPGQGGKPAPAWNCNNERDDCFAQWRAQATTLAPLLRDHAEFGRRCEALAVPGFAMEEPLPEPSTELRVPADQYFLKAIAPHLQNAQQCARWLKVQAVLAQQRGDGKALLAYLSQGDALVTGLLRGSRSLLGLMSSWSIAIGQWQLLSAMAAEQPALAHQLIAFIPPLPAEAQDASRWIVSEAYFGRQINRELGLGCELAEPQAQATKGRLACHPAIGFMPNATQQLMDEHWLQALALARQGPLALLDWRPEPQGLRLFGMAWRNTAGHILADVAMPSWTTYAPRQANLLLRQQAAALSLQAAAVKPDQRSAWLAQQALDPRLRERLQLDGDQIIARAWGQGSASEPTLFRYPIPRLQDT